jgi:hypothetical protein
LVQRRACGSPSPRIPVPHLPLLRKFTDLAFDESAEMRWRESQPTEADNMDVGPATETDLQSDLIEASRNPFWLVAPIIA